MAGTDFTEKDLLADRTALRRLIEEHRILREAIESSPVLFCVYDEQHRLRAWNKAYQDNHPEAFAAEHDRILSGDMTYGDLIRYQLARDHSGDALEAGVQKRVAQQEMAHGEPVERHYPGIGHSRVYKYQLPSGGSAGFAVDINDLKGREAELARTKEQAEAAEARLAGAIDAFPMPFVLYDRKERLVVCNAAYRDEYGAARDLVVPGAKLADLLAASADLQLYPESIGRKDAYIAEGLERHRTGPPEEEWSTADGRHFRLHRARLPDGDVAGVRFDITRMKQREAELEQARAQAEAADARLKGAVAALPVTFALYDHNDTLILCNEAYTRVFGPIAEQVVPGANLRDIVSATLDHKLFAHDTPHGPEFVEGIIRRHRAAENEEELRMVDGRCLQILRTRLPSGDLLSAGVDFTDLRKIQHELANKAQALQEAANSVRHQAMHDALTGLPNRRYLETRIEAMGYEPAEIPVALLHIDLDRFKPINDTIGHAAGDFILCHVADTLRAQIRKDDFAARIGGDEFVVVLPELEDADVALRMGRKIIEALSIPVTFEGHSCRVGASVGIAITDNIAAIGMQLIANADIALYRAKELGRNRAEVFTQELQEKMVRTKALADEILAGIEQDEFRPVYQPQFYAADLSLRGLEALGRWHHPAKGIVGPDEFVGIAEDLGMLERIDARIFVHAVDDIEALLSAGLPVPKVAFNSGARRLLGRDIFGQVSSLQDLGVQVAIELVESTSLDNLDENIAWAIDALKERGVGIEIDDFGSCRASIMGLMSVAPDAMKIAREIVEPITHSASHRRLVHAIVEIGNALGIEVVAEGVETREQILMLQDLGCDVLQGFAFGRPMPAADLRTYLRSEAWRGMPVAAGLGSAAMPKSA